MDSVYHGLLKEDLPEEYQQILNPENSLPDQVIFFFSSPMPWLRITLFILIGLPLVLGLSAFYYHFVISFFIDMPGPNPVKVSTFDRIIALTVIIFGTLGLWLFIDWCIEGFRIKKLINENRWRQGIYLFKHQLLIQFKGEDCYLIPQKQISEIQKVKIKGEGAGHHFRIDIYYQVDGDDTVLQLNEHDYDLYQRNIELATLGLHDFIKLYEVLDKWKAGKLSHLKALKPGA